MSVEFKISQLVAYNFSVEQPGLLKSFYLGLEFL